MLPPPTPTALEGLAHYLPSTGASPPPEAGADRPHSAVAPGVRDMLRV